VSVRGTCSAVSDALPALTLLILLLRPPARLEEGRRTLGSLIRLRRRAARPPSATLVAAAAWYRQGTSQEVTRVAGYLALILTWLIAINALRSSKAPSKSRMRRRMRAYTEVRKRRETSTAAC